MAADKDAAKRRRQARNRQERQQRQTRVQGARRSETGRPARTPDAVPTRKKKGSSASGTKAAATTTKAGSTGATAAAPASGGLLGKLFPTRTQTTTAEGTGGRPSRAQPKESVIIDVDEAPGARGWLQIRMSQPGGRPALLGLFVALVSAVTLLGFPVLPRFAFEGYGELVVQDAAAVSDATPAQTTQMVDTFNDADPISAGTSRLGDVAPLPFALVFSLIPIAITGLAVASLTKPTRSRTLLISALAAALYVFFSQSIGTFFILGVAALGFAAYKSRKADALAASEAADD
ncbi:hypothetical protein BH24ACT4_BH24ACT4_19380 [soil metagenome]